MADYSRDPDALYDDTVVAVLEIKVRRDGAMSVAGSINDLRYALAMCDNAKDAIRHHHARKASPLIVPSYDTSLFPG
jgi:hypothetical protein